VLVLATSGKVSFFLSSSLGVMFSFEYIILTLFPMVGIAASDLARTITLDVFATDESASVQATLYKMAQRLLVENKFIQSVTYTLPNKHYIPVDMKWAGVDNLNPYVFYCSTSQVHILDLSGYYSSHALAP
jgi:urate oxidase